MQHKALINRQPEGKCYIKPLSVSLAVRQSPASARQTTLGPQREDFSLSFNTTVY